MCFFFFNDTATTEIYTLSLHDALPISVISSDLPSAAATASPMKSSSMTWSSVRSPPGAAMPAATRTALIEQVEKSTRSEEHTSELQSRQYLVCRLLLEKKNKITLFLER